jgi:peptidyl-prolyl cis-trans isomerase C
MLKKISLLFSLGLTVLLASGTACKPAAEQKETGAAKADKTAAGQPATATGGNTAAGETPGGEAKPGTTAAGAPLSVQDLPEVVAKVNGHEIKKQELLQGAQVVQLRLRQMGRPAAPSAAFYRQVLNELIAITLLQQDAKAQGVAASEQEVQRQIATRKSTFPSKEAYEQALAQMGITEETLRQQARDQLSVQKYVETRLVKDVNVTEQATREFYEKNKAEIRPPERLHLRHILVVVGASATPEEKAEARRKAESLLERLQAGEDFAKLAQQSSDDPGSKPRGGDLGWVTKGQMVPPFEKAAFALTKPNELSPVVESPFGFQIIQLLEREKPGAVPYEKVKGRLTEMLKQQQAQRQVEARVRELRTKGKVEVFL